MRVTEGMLHKNRQQRNKRAAEAPQEPEDMELELPFPKMLPLDTAGSLFDQNAQQHRGGINTAPSVFDARAVFRTKKQED